MGNKVMMIVIIALLAVLIGLVGFVTFYGLQVLQNNTEQGNAQASVSAEKTLSQRDIDLVKFSNSIKANLKNGNDGKAHFVTLTVSVGIDNTDKKESPEVVALVQDREPVVRDIVGALLRDTTFEDLTETSDYQGIEVLRQNILGALRTEFATNLIATITMEIMYQ